jgi:coenzyme F420 hydrogenase subunit beta
MRRRIATITDVAERHLCTGCGVCAFVQPDDIVLVDDIDAGRRPIVVSGRSTQEALAVCPGVGLAHPDTHGDDVTPELLAGWGPVLELWEGHATDPEIRFAASSGGAATALALHSLERESMHGVLHIRARADTPYLNETTLSTTREELLSATGSRYAPASPCDGLQAVVDAPAACVFIGKPCDVAAAAKARARNPALDRKLGLTVAIFCAGTPSTRATLEMLDRLGVDETAELTSVRYRGNGWPGRAEAVVRTSAGDARRSLSYRDSWSQLQRHRPWRCHVCVDHSGEFADVSVGDPWYRPIEPGAIGESLVVVRSERGQAIVRAAREAGALELVPVPAHILPDSQPNLLATRGAVWARTAMTRAVGVAAPSYRNMPSYPHWRRLNTIGKIRSFTGTAKRIVTKRLYRRRPVVPWEPDR